MATTLEMLIDAVRRGELPPLPDPAAPVPMLPAPAPSVTVGPTPTMPDLPPTAPMPAADTNFINQYAGPAPIAPVQRQPGLLEKIAAVLSGIGSGPEYGMALREERQRPIREYNAALERYQGRRTQGIEIDERRRERAQERTQRQAEAQADREFNVWLKRTGVTDELATQQLRQAFEIQKIREQERVADERLERQDKAAKDKQRNDIYAKLITQDFAPQKFANEIADAIVFGKALSPAAEKWRSVKARKLEAQLANIGGGSGGSGPVMAELQNGQTVPASLVNSQSGGVMLNGALVPVVRYTGGRIPAPAGSRTEPFPGEAGGPQGPLIPRQETLAGGIRMTAPAPTKARARAKAKLRAGGYSAAEADQELDRLGIQ